MKEFAKNIETESELIIPDGGSITREQTRVAGGGTQLPPAVNWHLWPWCNYGCKFCFARFEDIPRARTLPKEKGLLVPNLLADAGAEKLTFVGGEPTLCPWLIELIAAAKTAGLTTCLVTNGSRLTEEFLDTCVGILDWIGLSIDASNDELHYRIGRGRRRDLGKGFSSHLSESIAVWDMCRDRGFRMKLNTVVCRTNLDDDMRDLVLRLRPERWKVFQVLPVEGQNDGDVDPLLIAPEAFMQWVERHTDPVKGLAPVHESNDVMRGSYAMMDALGRFYDSAKGCHTYSDHSILDVGVHDAWRRVSFDNDKFCQRDGEYSWEV